jgi:diphthamide biosynthesis enzyme Dph1/Dph2-like protein
MYDLELKKAIEKIKESKAKLVCIQLPDGLKPKAKNITDEIVKETNAEVIIWLGTNFGSCDIPIGLEKLKIDLLISWGHNIFHKDQGGWK